MKNKRLVNKTYTLTVEGECEKLYFEHLRKLINSNPNRKYNCEFKPVIAIKKNPLRYAKNFPTITNRFFHIQDIEDYNDEYQRKKFEDLINDIQMANKYVDYKLGYTNFSFELWIILHKRQMKHSISHRKEYVKYINEEFKRDYNYIDEYKAEVEFKKILSEITLDDIYLAIKRAKEIRKANIDGTSLSFKQKKIKFGKYEFFTINPDLDIFEIVEIILNDCLGNK